MILVTGGSGFIGGHLLDRLAGEGAQVRCLLRPTSSRRYVPSGAEVVSADLATGEGLDEALRGVDTVIHLAGVTKPRVPQEYETGNFRATEVLLGACGGCRRFVHVSSLAAAGPSETGKPLREDAPAHPVSAYGRSKWKAEEAVRKSALADRAVIVRPPVVYGPRDTDVFQILRMVSRGWTVRIGRERRLFSAIYVKDLAEGLIRAARSPGAAAPTSWRIRR